MPKSKYETHVAPYLDKIKLWAEKGAGQAEIAKKLGLAVSTFKLYLSKGDKGEEPYSDLRDCLTQACEVPDDEVEASLFKLCNGYNAPVVKNFKVKEVIYDPETGKRIKEVEKLVVGIDEVHVSANVTAQMFWLANRRSGKWQYKPEHSKSDEDNESGVVELPEVMPNPGPPKDGVEDG